MVLPMHRPRRSVLTWLLVLLGLVLPVSRLHGEDHLQAAKKALERYRFDEASKHLKEALKAEPRKAELHLLAAQAARRQGDSGEADKHLKEAEHLKASVKAVQLERWLLEVQTGEMDEAEAPLREFLANDHPQTSLILESLAVGYAANFRPRPALRVTNLLLEREPNCVPAYHIRGWLMERAGSLADAEKDYRRVLELDPQLDSARLSLAGVLYNTSRTEEAAKLYQEVGNRKPEDPKICLGLARCRCEVGKAEEARKLLDKLLSKHPDHVEGLHERGKLELQAGNLDNAEKWLRRAVKADPYGRQANYLLYQCFSQQGKEKEAQELRPKLQRIEADIERLMHITTKEMDRKPRDVGLRHEIGAILLRNGQEQTGLVWLNRALKLEPKHRPTHKLLAEYYEKTGDKKRAAEHRKLAQSE